MQERNKYITSQLLNYTQDSYLERTSRPIYAVIFLLPFIIFYELGTILINTDVLNQSQVRVVAFVWLQNFLEYLGTGSKLAWAAPPLTVVVILIALQLASRKRWWCNPDDILPMAVECILLTMPLIVLSLLLNTADGGDVRPYDSSAMHVQAELPHCLTRAADDRLSEAVEPGNGTAQSKSMLADIVTGIGAGIYEELVFRLILICALMVLFQDVLRFDRTNAIILAVLISAALFSAHHHIHFVDGQLNQRDPFNWMEFAFRTIAGIYFAVLFAFRGFGVTAGTHAFYDIIATIINGLFFGSGN